MAFQVNFLVFQLFFLQSQLTYALQTTTSFKSDLNSFSGVLRREENDTKLVHELKKHLMYLGYLHDNNLGGENYFDHHLEHAIKKYQEFYGINVTGVVDINTITSMRKPRCGVPDFSSPKTHFKSLYSFFEGNPKWRRKKFKYQMAPSIIPENRVPIEMAMREWQSRTPFTFELIRYAADSNAHITISFEVGDHGDHLPFHLDTPEMAHSFPPPTGLIHFNGHKRWACNGDPDAYDIITVALHEIGHLLGLAHSTVPESIMFPFIGLGQIKVIEQDDMDGIRALYNF